MLDTLQELYANVACRRRMLEEALPVPRLYYYSIDDQLCCAHELEALLKRKEEQ